MDMKPFIAQDATYKDKNSWEQAVKAAHPGVQLEFNSSNQSYVAKLNGREVGRFNYGQIRGGNLIAGNGWVD